VSYLLDTNAAISIMNGRPAVVRESLREARRRNAQVAISAIGLFELYYGVAHNRHQQQNAERLRTFLSADIDIIAFEPEDAAIAGELRAVLRSRGTPIGPYDLLIAAQGLRTGRTVVTANTVEFAWVDGLSYEDWSGAA
jgi:tRNA(fMet)-specific endonuclease VapC